MFLLNTYLQQLMSVTGQHGVTDTWNHPNGPDGLVFSDRVYLFNDMYITASLLKYTKGAIFNLPLEY